MGRNTRVSYILPTTAANKAHTSKQDAKKTKQNKKDRSKEVQACVFVDFAFNGSSQFVYFILMLWLSEHLEKDQPCPQAGVFSSPSW